MQVPFSGQSFASPSINGGYQPPQIIGSQALPPTGPIGSGVWTGPATLPQTGTNLYGAPIVDPSQSAPIPQPMTPDLLIEGLPEDQNFSDQGPVPIDLDVYVNQAPTGRMMIGGTYGTDNGLVGELIIDERNFDLLNFPRSVDDLFDARTWRGGGQTLRAEIVPGTDLERYLINFGEPYLFNSNVSLSLSGYYFDRQYYDWDEQRAGGRISLGRKLTNYLSVSTGLRLESVEVDNPRVGTSAQLNADLGRHDFYQFNVGLVYDTRQSPYGLESGEYLSLSFKQAFGDYSFSRGDIDFRLQRLLFQRTPTSGHHVISYRTQLGFTGSDTPVFENYLAGGFTSMRGFDFRGVSPIEGGVRVGGEFQWLNSLEYQFPITWDDMISGVAFVDFGTVEESIEIQSDNFRVAPGVGLRVNLPYAGMSAPLAFDFAFPVDEAAGDDKRTFSFLIGIVR